ncbi:MAG: OsmC family protein [Anaerolineaceae bacterium]|nr:OsmC family protein [Anaerolineaceae bacterium]
MNVKLNWQTGMEFIGAGSSGLPIRMSAGAPLEETAEGIRPMELIALGLIGCQAMDVMAILQKKRQQVTRFETRFDGSRASEHPKVFTRVEVLFAIVGRQIDESAVLRAIELTATKYCPAQAMLEQAFPIELRYEIYEEDADAYLTHQGVWRNTTER